MVGDCGEDEVIRETAAIRARLAEIAVAEIDDDSRIQELLYALYALCPMHFPVETNRIEPGSSTGCRQTASSRC